jgi:hypothetical protein
VKAKLMKKERAKVTSSSVDDDVDASLCRGINSTTSRRGYRQRWQQWVAVGSRVNSSVNSSVDSSVGSRCESAFLAES